MPRYGAWKGWSSAAVEHSTLCGSLFIECQCHAFDQWQKSTRWTQNSIKGAGSFNQVLLSTEWRLLILFRTWFYCAVVLHNSMVFCWEFKPLRSLSDNHLPSEWQFSRITEDFVCTLFYYIPEADLQLDFHNELVAAAKDSKEQKEGFFCRMTAKYFVQMKCAIVNCEENCYYCTWQVFLYCQTFLFIDQCFFNCSQWGRWRTMVWTDLLLLGCIKFARRGEICCINAISSKTNESEGAPCYSVCTLNVDSAIWLLVVFMAYLWKSLHSHNFFIVQLRQGLSLSF